MSISVRSTATALEESVPSYRVIRDEAEQSVVRMAGLNQEDDLFSPVVCAQHETAQPVARHQSGDEHPLIEACKDSANVLIH